MKFPIIKEILTRLGAVIPAKAIHRLGVLINYLNVGRWLHDRGLKVPVRFKEREEFYSHLAALVKEPVTYLEFGVFQGDSIRYWITQLKHRDNAFDGFDSFEGLPENWGSVCDKSTFDLGGVMPKFDDPRVRLFKGWFSNTLPGYVAGFTRQSQLIVHLDADLYSSTIFALRQLRSFLKAGDLLIFDEFYDQEHETKAMSEFLDEEHASVECLAATRTLTQVAFRITSIPGPPAGK